MFQRLAVVFCLLVLAATGCRQAPPADPATLRFSAIPDQPAERVHQQHQALIDRICAATHKSCRWVPAESYEALVASFGRGEVDVAYFGGVTYAQASQHHGAVPLAMRDIDFRFTSVIVVPRESNVRSLDGLKHARFAFANHSSTSGHYMLRRRLLDQNIIPERYFASVAFSADHDAAMHAVALGEADAAGVNANVFYRRVASGDAIAKRLRVIWQTPPYTDYVWAARRELSQPLRQALIDAFLDLDLSVASDRPALQAEGAGGFVPAFPADFDEVRAVLRSLGQL